MVKNIKPSNPDYAALRRHKPINAKKLFACLMMLALFPWEGFSQLKINEWLASNASINEDPDFKSNADWVELYNAGTDPVNLNGYYLTDNFTNPSKWKISLDAMIPAKGFILIWCDDKKKLPFTRLPCN
jgi:hypothetical protein